MSEPAALRVGVLVPCRNEALVIARKLANLAQLDWPAGEHRIVVVDDGSEDGTAERARAAARSCFPAAPGAPDAINELGEIGEIGARDDDGRPAAPPPAGAAGVEANEPGSRGSRARAAALPALCRARVRVDVVANAVRPGKPGAIQQGLLELGASVDLVLLTDADVVADERAIVALERAFRDDRGLALACGAQRFVRDLADDGTCRARSLESPARADGLFDRATAHVRALESRFGMLFSVHGQWLAWRADLGLAPRLGFAADDLDLMLQARARGPSRPDVARARRIPTAVFYEVKTPPGDDADAQALRRARAYVQVLRASRPPERGVAARLQWSFYRHAPLHAPLAAAFALVLAHGLAFSIGVGAGVAVTAVTLACAASPPGRRCLRLLRTIRRATRLEAKGALSERWEMARR